MLGISFEGRLGNQMFQYAFIHSQSRYLKVPFFIEKHIVYNGNFKLYKYFKLTFFDRVVNRIFWILFKFSILRPNTLTNCYQNGDDDIKSILELSSNNIYWNGFFQSEEFFHIHKNRIKKLFILKKYYLENFKIKYQDIFNKHEVLVLHIRRTDYLYHGNDSLGTTDISLPMEYYDKCLTKIHNLDRYYKIVLSDDIEFSTMYFDKYKNFHFIHDSEINDFQIMLNADMLIISNSTFAWWAAYLNTITSSVYAPMYWMGFCVQKEYPKGIMTNKFQWVNVYEK